MDNTLFFSPTEAVKTAWNKVHGVKTTFFIALLILVVLQLMTMYLNKQINPTKIDWNDIYILIFMLIIGVVRVMLLAGLNYLGIQRAENVPININMISYGFSISLFFKIIWLSFITMFLFMVIGVIAGLAVPFLIAKFLALSSAMAKLIMILAWFFSGVLALFFAMRFSMANGIVIMEKDLTAWKAIKKSYRVTDGQVFNLFFLMVVNIGITALTILTLGIGFIWTIPYLFINYGEVYKRLIAIDKQFFEQNGFYR